LAEDWDKIYYFLQISSLIIHEIFLCDDFVLLYVYKFRKLRNYLRSKEFIWLYKEVEIYTYAETIAVITITINIAF